MVQCEFGKQDAARIDVAVVGWVLVPLERSGHKLWLEMIRDAQHAGEKHPQTADALRCTGMRSGRGRARDLMTNNAVELVICDDAAFTQSGSDARTQASGTPPALYIVECKGSIVSGAGEV
ncbi:uncharacterized protein FOMMEDRAFT_171281 [Fomitiporia mediterranea MF3/22]|uniref:uncharacterized protein n=1 Tax=Fomitiporia mediterranea (strain MF3/22) TaxID=694068 RepID=UPI0004408DF5|nr:uncharacterized protein FOMMEDRAFT_171281 [Fomitiporia mediterranea MF3/22]EJC97871.1 hypothetical protein FOMMEDRAFT_171281 [Fomitiporia mediterranea MF3/22]